MSGQTNLSEVLKTLNVTCDNLEYGFATVKDKQIDITGQVLGVFEESEGKTIIATTEYLEVNNLQHEGSYAKLTIELHTSLELVCLTATLAQKLAENKIPVNVIAGYYHDHLFVPYGLRQNAINAISNLAASV
jgi:uncharacterized protein